MILEEETFKKFGYYPRDLLSGSGKSILAACDGCGKVRTVRKHTYRSFCHKCATRKNNNWKIGRMLRFEDLYSRFCAGLLPWGDEIVNELHFKARRANPYALNIWRVLDKDFTFNPRVRDAIRLYYRDMLPHKQPPEEG